MKPLRVVLDHRVGYQGFNPSSALRASSYPFTFPKAGRIELLYERRLRVVRRPMFLLFIVISLRNFLSTFFG